MQASDPKMPPRTLSPILRMGAALLGALAIAASAGTKAGAAGSRLAPDPARAEANRQFVESLITQKRSLVDFPGRVLGDFVVHEPAVLPFGGTYRGMEAFKRLFESVRGFYDFGRFEVQGVHGAGDHVFVRLRVGLAGSPGSLWISEDFRFEGDKVAEVRVYVFDEEGAPLRLRE